MTNLNFQKGIAPIIAVVILAVIFIGGAYYFKQQQTQQASKSINETANWKTYTNKELGFSINYPKEWEINDSCSSISGNKQYEKAQFLCTLNVQSYSYKTSGGAPIIDVNPGAPNGSIVDINVYSNSKNLDTEKFVISKEGLNHGDLGTISKEKKGNNDFIKESFKDDGIPNLGSFYIRGDEGKAFWISGTIFAKDGTYQKMPLNEINKYRDIYEQMLSTFKLTNQNQVIDISSWQTYTNTVGKFTIDYPLNWTLKETHERSNRVVDDPKEINTTTLTGKEGQIILQWGPMGFGGGCNEEDHKTLQLKDASIQICNNTSSNGEYWSQIYSPKNHEPAFGASATGILDSKNLIEKIFSTLSFY